MRLCYCRTALIMLSSCTPRQLLNLFLTFNSRSRESNSLQRLSQTWFLKLRNCGQVTLEVLVILRPCLSAQRMPSSFAVYIVRHSSTMNLSTILIIRLLVYKKSHHRDNSKLHRTRDYGFIGQTYTIRPPKFQICQVTRRIQITEGLYRRICELRSVTAEKG